MADLIGIYDHELGENVIRAMTAAEQKERDAEIEAALNAKAAIAAQKAAAIEAKAALFAKLGISEDEAKLLLA